ncbi:copper resistance CopC family protein [Rhodovastum atsumiense]|nr:copper resistance protein CopC [Rhodovastum atsumiense]
MVTVILGVLRLMLLLCVTPGVAEARILQLRESSPAAEAVVAGDNVQYVVRFDGLVDHAASRLEIIDGSAVVLSLVPVLDSEPDVLAASAPALPPGQYQLRWIAKSRPDGEVSSGLIPFTVGQ